MGIFSRKTAEEKQAALQAKLDKASAKIDRESKHVERERGQFDTQTMRHKATLAKRGVDVRDATGVIMSSETQGSNAVFVATMPDAVSIYTVQLFGGVNKLKATDTIPYSNINSVQFDKGTIKDTLTLVTSGHTYVVETTDHGRFIVDYINERR